MSTLANGNVSSTQLESFERKLRETLCELAEKREQTTSQQQKIQELLLTQNDLRRELDRVQSELQGTKKQLGNAVSAIHSTGEQLNSKIIQESSIVTKLEVASRERDLLSQQARNVSLENVTLKHRIEVLETKQRYIGKIQDNVESLKKQFTTSVDDVKREIKRLENDQNKVEQGFEDAKKTNEKLQRENSNIQQLLKESVQKEKDTKQEAISLRAKLQKLEQDQQMSTERDYSDRIRQLSTQWQGWLQSLSDALVCERRNITELRKAMSLLEQNLKSSQQLEELTSKELDAERHKSDTLSRNLEQVQQQLRNVKLELEELQLLQKKAVSVDSSTEMTPVEYTSTYTMMDTRYATVTTMTEEEQVIT